MASKTVFIFSLAISATIARAYPADYNTDPWVLSEEQLKNFTYDPKNLEAGPYFEGDIMFVIPDESVVRNGRVGDRYRWPDNTIVYSIDGDFTDEQIEYIYEAQRQLTEITDDCVQFREKNANDRAYVSVVNGQGCSSVIGYNGIKQELQLATGCFYVKWVTVAHEFLHAFGFYHQQSSADRDDWVTIINSNIKRGYERNFRKEDQSTSFGEKYDYDSVMHYPKDAFGVNGKTTIVPKTKGVSIGQRDHISDSDARKLKKMYRCE